MLHHMKSTSDHNHGLLTQSHTKKIQVYVNAFLTSYDFSISKDGILPNYSTLMLLRFTHEEEHATNMNKCNDL